MKIFNMESIGNFLNRKKPPISRHIPIKLIIIKKEKILLSIFLILSLEKYTHEIISKNIKQQKEIDAFIT